LKTSVYELKEIGSGIIIGVERDGKKKRAKIARTLLKKYHRLFSIKIIILMSISKLNCN